VAPKLSCIATMGNTYTQLVYHIVFSTKHRAPLITCEIQAGLYDYMGGIVQKQGGSLLQIGGMPDHVHLLTRFPARVSMSDTVRSIKANSSLWLGQSGHHFKWQDGYGAFSVSHSRIAAVRHYIETQKEHHTLRTFKEELITLLRKHRVEFQERYLFD
jgi:Transposase and inactivated derivatives